MTYLRSVLTALALTLLGTTAAQAATCAPAGNASAMVQQVERGLNAQRQAHRLGAVQYNPHLANAAMSHACDMHVNAFFDHRGSDGSNLQSRAQRNGYRHCLIAENLASGYPRPEQIISGWMNSAGHRRNMLLPGVSEYGLAVVDGQRGPIWVLVMARGC